MNQEAIAAQPKDEKSHFGAVLAADAEFGGDNVVKVFYVNGSTRDIKARQGVTVSAGAHYRPASSALDFTATVGYKFVRTSDYNTDLGMDRWVLKLTGSYSFQNIFGWKRDLCGIPERS